MEPVMSTVLITGTSKGIGYETALCFARAGHKVLATMRNPAQAPALAEIAAREKLPIIISSLDVDSDSSVSEGIAALTKTHGDIDVLVNNAGVETVGSVEETALNLFRSVMETNFFGVIRCTQAVLPQMRARGSGCIVQISSVAGRFSQPPFAAYCASKWALEAMTEALAGEMKTFGVRVALVEPGIIDTAMAQRISHAGTSKYRQGERVAGFFAKSLEESRPTSIVAEKILEVVEGGTWQLRHPVGPDALPLISSRQSMTDEAWVDWHSADDETFFAAMAG
jgi:NAD(P)-dependent dehydrogenase (short-subunit alcohol dehydrogenase family)